jgi:FdhD protein
MQSSTRKRSESLTIMPNPSVARLTQRAEGIDQTGARVSASVPVERSLTLYLNSKEIVTMMTIGDYPECLAIGYLLNQNMLKSDDILAAVEYDDDLGPPCGTLTRPTNPLGKTP